MRDVQGGSYVVLLGCGHWRQNSTVPVGTALDCVPCGGAVPIALDEETGNAAVLESWMYAVWGQARPDPNRVIVSDPPAGGHLRGLPSARDAREAAAGGERWSPWRCADCGYYPPCQCPGNPFGRKPDGAGAPTGGIA